MHSRGRSSRRSARKTKNETANGNINIEVVEIEADQGIPRTRRTGTGDTEGIGHGQDLEILTGIARGDTDTVDAIDLGQETLQMRRIDGIDTDTARVLRADMNATIAMTVTATDDAQDLPITNETTETDLDDHHAPLEETMPTKKRTAIVAAHLLTKGGATRTKKTTTNDLVLRNMLDETIATDSPIHALPQPKKRSSLLRALPKNSPKCKQMQTPWKSNETNA